MRHFLWLSVLSLTLSGCDNAFYSTISEKTQDPLASTPTVSAFSSLLGNQISWSSDPNASGYILYRRLLTSTIPAPIYQGTGTSVLDTLAAGAASDTMYAYTLAKIRGDKTFDVGGISYGAWDNSYTAFPYGDNSTISGAVAVSTDTISGTIFYYSTASDAVTGAQVLINAPNWYYVDLGPRLQEYLVFNYGTAAQSGDLIVSTNVDTTIVNGGEFSVFNASTAAQRVWFNVHFNPSVASVSTQTLVNYSMVFNRTTSYP